MNIQQVTTAHKAQLATIGIAVSEFNEIDVAQLPLVIDISVGIGSKCYDNHLHINLQGKYNSYAFWLLEDGSIALTEESVNKSTDNCILYIYIYK